MVGVGWEGKRDGVRETEREKLSEWEKVTERGSEHDVKNEEHGDKTLRCDVYHLLTDVNSAPFSA